MSKSFQKQILDQHFKQNQKLDPFVFITPEVSQFADNLNFMMACKFILSYLVTNAIVAPLQTVGSSLQLSVKKHKDIYQSQQARSKQLTKLNTQMTIHQKRKFQLMIRAGGKTQPYTAPVYNGYKQTIQSLKGQGWRAFFKGLAFRSLTSALYFYPFAKNTSLISQQQIKQGIIKQNFKLYGFCLLIDCLINPLHMQENRFILQNRLPQFRTIKRPFKSINRMMQQGQATKGLIFHFINNTIGFVTRFPAYLQLISGKSLTPVHYGTFLIGQFFAYPFSTAYKRLQCQSERYAGMIPIRYSGLFHAMRVITYQEGTKGLWRAFPLHLAQSAIRLKLLQFFTGNSKSKQ